MQHIVSEVIRRLAPRLGADGSRGSLVTVFTGATVGFSEALQQVRSLILDGFCIQLVFSPAAEQLYGRAVLDQLTGFPHVDCLNASKWLSSLGEARGVVVPLLSVNTVSKISSLIADNLATNLILHGLFMGKAVILACNGADPSDRGRQELGFHKGSPALQQALHKRLQTVAQYGCELTDVESLRDTVNRACAREEIEDTEKPGGLSSTARPTCSPRGKVVTATDVSYAHQLGAHLMLSEDSLVTPLARDLAIRYDVPLVKPDKH